MKTLLKSRKALTVTCLGGLCLTFAGVLTAAVPADAISLKTARELIRKIAGANLNQDQVEIKKISSGVGGDAVVEARIETAFRLTKDKGDWRIAEVRLGDRQWESFELIEEAVKREKARRTTVWLKELADGLSAYQRDRGRYVESNEIAELLDCLSPLYLSTPRRFDWWGKQFVYTGTATGYRLVSAGPDSKPGTSDDLVIENGELKTVSQGFGR